MSRKVKYMGSADEATIPKGNTFGGTVSEPTTSDLVFNKANGWIVDVNDAGLTDAQIEALLEDSDRFKDVSGMARIPHNRHQTTFHARKSMGKTEEKVSEAESTVSDGTTTAGGSTAGKAPKGGATS